MTGMGEIERGSRGSTRGENIHLILFCVLVNCLHCDRVLINYLLINAKTSRMTIVSSFKELKWTLLG